MGLIDIQKEYARLNKKWWGGRLPKDVVVEWSDKLPEDWMEGTYVHGMSKNWPRGCGRRPNHHMIRLHPGLQKWECHIVMALFHGMVHMSATVNRNHHLLAHGKHFNEEMRLFALAGAFDLYL